MYGFSLVVNGLDLDDESQNAALEFLPYDAVVSSSGGVVTIDVECDSRLPSESVSKVYEDLKDLRIQAVRIDLDLVGLSDIAERVDSNRETIRLWSTGDRRSGFPKHFTTAGGSRLWAWTDVYEWIVAQNIQLDDMYDWVPLPLEIIESFNGAFAQVRNQSTEGWIHTTVPSEAVQISSTHTLARAGWESYA